MQHTKACHSHTPTYVVRCRSAAAITAVISVLSSGSTSAKRASQRQQRCLQCHRHCSSRGVHNPASAGSSRHPAVAPAAAGEGRACRRSWRSGWQWRWHGRGYCGCGSCIRPWQNCCKPARAFRPRACRSRRSAPVGVWAPADCAGGAGDALMLRTGWDAAWAMHRARGQGRNSSWQAVLVLPASWGGWRGAGGGVEWGGGGGGGRHWR